MKSQKGITLTSLAIYVIVMVIVLGVMGQIIDKFYSNTDGMEASTEDILKFSKFNTYFLDEIKRIDNKVDKINNDDNKYILFTSGNSFSYSDNKIYYNNIEICDGVNEFTIQQGKDGDGLNEDILYVNLSFDNYSKSINYKLEEIY